MTHLSLFSGIGGIDLAAEWAGFETIGFCEQNEYCQKVLARHWPGVPIFDDVRTVDTDRYRGATTLVTGGFPCQDISQAGKRVGLSGERSGLWFEMLRVIGKVRPSWVVAENVDALIRMGIDTCLAGLEAEGYTTRTLIVPACGVGAVHRRNRCFIVAYSSSKSGNGCGSESRSQAQREPGDCDSQRSSATPNTEDEQDGRLLVRGMAPNIERDACSSDRHTDFSGLEGQGPIGAAADSNACNPSSCGLPRQPRWRAGQKSENGHSQSQENNWRDWPVKPVFRRDDDGLPPGMEPRSRTARLRALGNAVDPYQVFPILQAIATEIKRTA